MDMIGNDITTWRVSPSEQLAADRLRLGILQSEIPLYKNDLGSSQALARDIARTQQAIDNAGKAGTSNTDIGQKKDPAKASDWTDIFTIKDSDGNVMFAFDPKGGLMNEDGTSKVSGKSMFDEFVLPVVTILVGIVFLVGAFFTYKYTNN